MVFENGLSYVKVIDTANDFGKRDVLMVDAFNVVHVKYFLGTFDFIKASGKEINVHNDMLVPATDAHDKALEIVKLFFPFDED